MQTLSCPGDRVVESEEFCVDEPGVLILGKCWNEAAKMRLASKDQTVCCLESRILGFGNLWDSLCFRVSSREIVFYVLLVLLLLL